MRKVEIDSFRKLAAWLEADAAGPPAVFQGLDLVPWADSVVGHSLVGCAFFGCRLGPVLSAAAEAAGCLIDAENDHLLGRRASGRTHASQASSASARDAGPREGLR